MTIRFRTKFRQYFYVEIVTEGSPTDEGMTAEEVAYETAYRTYKDADIWIQSDMDSMLVIDGPYVDDEYEPKTCDIDGEPEWEN